MAAAPTTAVSGVCNVQHCKSGFEVRFIDLSITRERVYCDGEVVEEKFNVTANDDLLLESGSFLEADQAIAEYITRDTLDA